MKLKLRKDVVEKYPHLRIGVVVAHGVENKSETAQVEELKKASEIKLRTGVWEIDNILDHPFISAWRETYKSFGVKPKEYMPTAESIIRRVLKGNNLPKISTVVDTYLAVELDNFLPIGGYDLDLISGDILLRFSDGGEKFTPLGGGQKETKAGEVVYSDDARVLTVRWNYLDSDETKITLDTRNFILCIEAADLSIPDSAIEKATKDLCETLKLVCPGEYTSFIANAKTAEEWNID
jgi:DNA/RNA-binding domain of Phe-tRNA-synthetase-like protein